MRTRPSIPTAVPAATAALVGVVVLGVGGAPTTTAAFTDAAELGGGAFSAGTMTAPGTPEVEQVRGPGSTRITWTAPPMGQHGGAPSAYDVYRYPAPDGGAPTLACSVDVGVSSDVGRALGCDDTSRTPGTHHYAVRARQGEAWQAESDRREITPDLTGPAVGILDPVDGYRGAGLFLRLGLLFSCGGAPACGDAGDPAGMAAVRWTLEVETGGGSVRCWDGGSYGGETAAGTCPDAPAVVEGGGTGVQWRLPGTSDGPFRARGTYVLRVTGIDDFANATTSTSVVTLL